MIREFLVRVWEFIKEIIMFGIDAFMIAAAREIGKRFMHRLKQKGGAIAQLEEPKHQVPVTVRSGIQGGLPFLDEYRD
jgi:hypothetical protein